ncbi:endonuclease domain-containing protein [Microbacterium sp. CJ88]|uniref:endonuclease domain-containing protein n=1 Tax=Microbacterium sp. CJ88 TaxID=3445672 RepID=UPI003F658EC6
MELLAWIGARDGIAHRRDILDAGFPVAVLRAVLRDPQVEVLRRQWVVLESAPPVLRAAAGAGGRVACVTLARRRGWWMPEGVDSRTHLHVHPHAAAPAVGDDVVRHWTIPPTSPQELEESAEDALAHIAGCVPREDALVIWESAIRVEKLAVEALRAIPWSTRAAAECALAVVGLSDSGLETMVVLPLRRSGLRVRQQIMIAGRRVDLLIDERLVVQIDGFEFHSSAGQRSKDIAHDVELRLRGYTVLRFGYAQVVHDRAEVGRAIRRAVAAGLHRAQR